MQRLWRPRARKRCRVMLALPTYNGQLTDGIAQMIHQSGELNRQPGHPFEYGVYILRGFRPVEYARNILCWRAVKDGWADRVLMVDQDMVPPDNWQALLDNKAPAVSGLAFGWQDSGLGKKPTLLPVLYQKTAAGTYQTMHKYAVEPFEVDACGAAALALTVKLLRDVMEWMPYDGPEPYPFFQTIYAENGKVELGEDVVFFDKIGRHGVKPLIDPRVPFGHIKGCDLLDVGMYGMSCRDNIVKVGEPSKEPPYCRKEENA